jgi:uncharacterized protein (DUF2237 family)
MVQLEDSISEHLRHHTLSKMLFNRTSKVHHARILSCFGPRAGTWLIVRLVFSTFWLFSPMFCTTLHTWFGLPHPSIASILRCVCTHPINPMGIHLLCCALGNEHIGTHNVIHDTFVAIAWDVGFHVGQKQLHVLLSTTFNSSSQSPHYVDQKWHSHLGQHCHCQPNASGFTSLILCNSRICYIGHNSSQGKELSQPTPHWSIPPFSNQNIWLLTQTGWCVLTRLCQCHLELEGVRKPSSFYLGHFSSLNFFWSHYKGCRCLPS